MSSHMVDLPDNMSGGRWKIISRPANKIFCFNNSDTREIKDLSNFSKKEIHVTFQSDNTKHRPCQFISWLNFMEWFQILSPAIGGKVLTN